jgi:glycosyltransferase XagB
VRLLDPDSSPESFSSAAATLRSFALGRDDLAIEIAFLADYGVPRGPLLAATKAARASLTADQALIGQDFIREDEFYRLLARHLRAPFYCGEFALSRDGDLARIAKRGIALLEPNASGLTTVLAPRGQALAFLLGGLATRGLPPSCALTSPQRLEAVMRFQLAIRVADEAAGALERADSTLSAHSGLSRGQWAATLILTPLVLVAGLLRPDAAGAGCAIALWATFGAASLLRLATTIVGAVADAAPSIDDDDLPLYSIIAPLKNETNIVGKLIDALDAIDYPKCKLDIKIVIERDDQEMLTALASMRLPSRYDVIVAPPGAPATKPRALNVAFPSVRGELVVVYDAEDEPDPDQLRLAAARFRADRTVDCLQARLVVANIDQSWLTRLFAIEYCALFDVINPGLAFLRAPVPLGGSSNHFQVSALRRVGGWDAWNVTEDADLGLRLARFGCRVATLASDTLEEAPPRLGPWFGQRRRWIKGWYQTLAVHSRDPGRVVREMGGAPATAGLVLMLGATLGGLFGPPFLVYACWECLCGRLFATSTIIEGVSNVATLLLMVLGANAILVPIVLALRERGLQRLYRTLPLLPLYYCLVTAAAWAALADLVFRPYHWSKTKHGLSSPANSRMADIRD